MSRKAAVGHAKRAAAALLPLAALAVSSPSVAETATSRLSVTAIVQPSCSASASPPASGAGYPEDAVEVTCSSGASGSATVQRVASSPLPKRQPKRELALGTTLRVTITY